MAIPAVAAPIIVTTLAVFFASFGNEYFVPNACERLQKVPFNSVKHIFILN